MSFEYVRKSELLGVPGIVARICWREDSKVIWSGPLFFPKDQGRFGERHPRHPQGYGQVETACISPSVSYYKKLCDKGRFRWRTHPTPIEKD